ncbi:MAG TPA: glycosyltransferase family 39 protein [Candidatus Dormibacteraeota bacterium]|nr:glycosyltransferase family 39 protein [Candidatus Dormibacteraeota bacterium]
MTLSRESHTVASTEFAAVAGTPHTFRVRWLFLIAIVCGLAWRLARMGMHFELTGDEAGIMRSVVERDYGALLQPLSYFNVSPPLFLWMTKFIDSLFRSDWAARVAPFLAGLGSVGVFWLICRDTLGGTARWIAMAVLCVSYVPVVEGTRTKGYTIDLLVAMVVLWLILQWELRGHKARYLAWLALCAPLFIWLSYTSIFVIGAAGLILAGSLINRGMISKRSLAASGWPNVVAALALALTAAASALLLYQLNIRAGLQASHANGLANGWKAGYPPLHQPWKIPWWLLVTHTGRGFAWPIGDNNFGSTPMFLLWLAGLVIYWRRGNRWVWALFVLPQLFALVAAFANKYPYLQNPRICMFLGPGICLFIGAGAQYLISRFGRTPRRALYGGMALALTLCALGGLGRDIALRIREIKGPGIRSTLLEASRVAGPNGQFVVLNDQDASWLFAYYAKRAISQPVLWHGQTPTQSGPGSKLALVLVGRTQGNAQQNPLFGEFEKRFSKSLTVKWSQVAHQVLLGSKETITVWVCE